MSYPLALDRSHHRTTTTTTTTTTTASVVELFICFTSRLSSSSMKLTKSILSPSHARDLPLSLPTSLSRRLKTNGSIKGGQSPMFPTTNKKRGSSFENPEPSSPKVTCIGQVKMKTKKKVKQSRSLSKRRSDGSFRKVEQTPAELLNQRSLSVHFQPPQECAAHRNQRWVHLPFTIYEALREFSCLFPCRSSCFTTNEKEKEEKINGSKCAFARWLVALQNGEAEKNREIEFVVANNGEEEEERIEEMKSRMRSSRRHVFEDIEFKDIESSVEMKKLGVPEEEEKARVSICVPPKNALLLMRCRSDPMKMADLTNKFWESPARKEEIGENEQVEKELADAEKFEGNNELEVIDKGCEETEETSDSVNLVENEEISESVEIMEMEKGSSKDEEKLKSIELEPETEQEDEEESEINTIVAEVNSIEQVPELIVDQTTENIEDNKVPELEKEEEEGSSTRSYSSFSENSSESREDTSEATEEEETFNSTIKKMEETLLLEHIDEDAKQDEEEIATKSDVEIAATEKNEVEKGDIIKSVLPDCLLMMMYEPKLSMEVSKETWVHSTDFILPEREKQAKLAKKRISIDSKPPYPVQDNRRDQQLLIPPRSSCCLPAAGVPALSMATMIEQKLVNAVACEPFVLTRCKSEPMRMMAAAKLAPESCFWKNRKFEPHRPATFGVGF